MLYLMYLIEPYDEVNPMRGKMHRRNNTHIACSVIITRAFIMTGHRRLVVITIQTTDQSRLRKTIVDHIYKDMIKIM